jgi:hypothetical protein
MASIEGALLSELQATPGVTALVGARIYPGVAPQNATAPYITYERVSQRVEHDLNGGGSLCVARMSYLCHAATYAAAKSAGAAIVAALDERRGVMGGVTVGAILSEMEADAGFDDELRMHVVAVDFRVLYQP